MFLRYASLQIFEIRAVTEPADVIQHTVACRSIRDRYVNNVMLALFPNAVMEVRIVVVADALFALRQGLFAQLCMLLTDGCNGATGVDDGKAPGVQSYADYYSAVQ